MLPRSSPGLELMVNDAANMAREGIHNKALGNFIAGAMDKVALLAEPAHYGYTI